MQKDDSLIPPGEYCYRVEKIADGEVLSEDIERFGKDLREFSWHRGYKEVLCPYWRRTDYGTVRCEYLDVEVICADDPDAPAQVIKHFGAPDIPETIGYSWELEDEIKICGVRVDEDEQQPI